MIYFVSIQGWLARPIGEAGWRRGPVGGNGHLAGRAHSRRDLHDFLHTNCMISLY